ncbi:hypothetical protein WMY93_009422 [Mugilogobius chulae]|uniref:Uncharacterized protein n=1 Tax=Mugilogobius chulae TaxID=88201 RepID=A0AAW0PM38_9GOBI
MEGALVVGSQVGGTDMLPSGTGGLLETIGRLCEAGGLSPGSLGPSPQCWSHGLHRAWQGVGRSSHSEKAGPAKPSADRSKPQTSWLETKTSTTSSVPQGAHAILEQDTASSAFPQALISTLFLFLGGALQQRALACPA